MAAAHQGHSEQSKGQGRTPCSLEAALTLWIHKERMSLFFVLRSLYAY